MGFDRAHGDAELPSDLGVAQPALNRRQRRPFAARQPPLDDHSAIVTARKSVLSTDVPRFAVADAEGVNRSSTVQGGHVSVNTAATEADVQLKTRHRAMWASGDYPAV